MEIAFEAALAELEQIVEALERGGPDLTQALAGYGRGVALLGHCQGILDGAERSVALLTGIDDAGQPVTAPFDAAATVTPPLAVTVPVEVVAPLLKAVPSAAPTPALTPAPPPKPPTPKEPPAPRTTIPEAPF